MVNAARHRTRAASGNLSTSFNADFIHETGRVALIINYLYLNVVIYDNICQGCLMYIAGGPTN